MTRRGQQRAEEALFGQPPPSRRRPVALGDRVRIHGRDGIVTAIDYSLSTHTRVVTVQHSPRERMRVDERDVELL